MRKHHLMSRIDLNDLNPVSPQHIRSILHQLLLDDNTIPPTQHQQHFSVPQPSHPRIPSPFLQQPPQGSPIFSPIVNRRMPNTTHKRPDKPLMFTDLPLHHIRNRRPTPSPFREHCAIPPLPAISITVLPPPLRIRLPIVHLIPSPIFPPTFLPHRPYSPPNQTLQYPLRHPPLTIKHPAPPPNMPPLPNQPSPRNTHQTPDHPPKPPRETHRQASSKTIPHQMKTVVPGPAQLRTSQHQ